MHSDETGKVFELETFAGTHILTVCKEAVNKAEATGHPVHFEFNGTHVVAQPGETAEALVARWTADDEAAAEAYRNDPQRKIKQAEREEADRKARAASMAESAVTEKEMCKAVVPWPLTPEQLTGYVESLVNRTHDYGTCVYAMSMAAVAAFNYVSHCLGVTGFQASCADMDILRRTRSLDGPFMIIKAEDALYPQYDLMERLAKTLEEWKPWLAEEAEKKLAENTGAVPAVLEHWQRLANNANVTD